MTVFAVNGAVSIITKMSAVANVVAVALLVRHVVSWLLVFFFCRARGWLGSQGQPAPSSALYVMPT